MRHKRWDLSGRGVDLRNLPKLLGVSANVLGAWSASHSRPGFLDDISGNNRHLTAGGTTPVITNSAILGVDGNPVQTYNYGGAGYHSLAYNPNCFDTGHTIFQIVRSPTSAPAVYAVSFCHSVESTDGVYFGINSGGQYAAVYSKSGGAKAAGLATSMVDGLPRLVCLVRNGNWATVYVDGIPGTPADVTDCGIDGSKTLYIGRYNTASNYWTGNIAYTLLLNTALSHRLITRAQHLLMGSCAGRSAGHFAVPTFQRASTSYCERKGGDRSLVQVPANYPVQGPDGGQLIQGSVTNLIFGSTVFGNATWFKDKVTVEATPVVLPDGTTGTQNALRDTPDGADPQRHRLYNINGGGSNFPLTVGAVYTFSIYLRSVARTWIQLQVYDGVSSFTAFVDTATGNIGTLSSATCKSKPCVDGGYRFAITFTAGNATGAGFFLNVADADGDILTTGTGTDCYYMFGAQAEAGAFATTYINTPTGATVTRAADSETWIPWSVNKALLPCLSAQHQSEVKLHFKGSESLNAATVTPTTGAYTFTKNGRPQNGYTEAEQDFLLMNGSTDYLSLADTGAGDPFRFAGNFSIIAAYTPLTVTDYRYIISKHNATTYQRGFAIYQSSTDIACTCSNNGLATFTASVASCLEVGKPALITVSYSTVSGLSVSVDAFAAGTQAATGALFGSNSPLSIGRYEVGSSYLNAKLLQLIILDHGVGGAVVSAAEHAALYQAWKQPGFLDLTMNASSPKTKIVIELEARGLYSSTSNIGAARRLITIGGATGQCSSTKNSIAISSDADGKLTALMYENSDGTKRFISSAARTDLDKWHKHVFVLDLANSVNSTYTIDGTPQTLDASMTGTGNQLDLLDALVRIGQPTTGIPDLNGSVRALKIYAQ